MYQCLYFLTYMTYMTHPRTATNLAELQQTAFQAANVVIITGNGLHKNLMFTVKI